MARLIPTRKLRTTVLLGGAVVLGVLEFMALQRSKALNRRRVRERLPAPAAEARAA